jgi:hypothetical protein
MVDEVEIMRGRLHDMADKLAAVVTRIEVTAVRVEGFSDQLGRIEHICNATSGHLKELNGRTSGNTQDIAILKDRADQARNAGRTWGLTAGGIGTAIAAALAYFLRGFK